MICFTLGSKMNIGRSAGLIVLGNRDRDSSLSMANAGGTSAAGPAELNCGILGFSCTSPDDSQGTEHLVMPNLHTFGDSGPFLWC
jgi:hypothetical protein